MVCCVRLCIIERSQWRDQQLRDSAVLSLRHSFIHGFTQREREREIERETAIDTAWPASSKHPSTADTCGRRRDSEIDARFRPRAANDATQVSSRENGKFGAQTVPKVCLERYSRRTVGRLEQETADVGAFTGLPCKAQWLLYVPPGLAFRNSTFCPHNVFMCFESQNKHH